jgi:hypothetical protein
MPKPKLETVKPLTEEEKQVIAKPKKFDLAKFTSKMDPDIAGAETLLTALPHMAITQAGDYVMLHHDQVKYWSHELCFVNVPVKGQKRDTLHLIEEEIAVRFVSSARIRRFKLALASKPFDVFFLCHVPTRNQDNSWVSSNIQGCELATTRWVEVTSRRDEGVEAYRVKPAKDGVEAFQKPNWPKQPLDELICVTFAGRMIDHENHPGLLRIIGAKQAVS